jgi:hypothetical protein
MLPFAAVPVLLLPSPLGALFKDLVAVIPTYIGFLLWLRLRSKRLRGVPAMLVIAMAVFTALVLVQLVNPALPNMLMGLIGAKVWLFYIPIYFLAYAFCETEHDLIKLARILVALSFIPTAFGLLEFALSLSIGYERTMTMFYGGHAEAFTQQFAQFEPDSGFSIFRIPSTFPFLTQYFGFILGVIPAAFFVAKTDLSRNWRRAAWISLAFLFSAGLTCGSRAAFIFLPLELVTLIILTGDLRNTLRQLAVVGFVSLLGILLFWSKITVLYTYESALLNHYANTIAEKGLKDAITEAPLGKGTGTNTGPARYAFGQSAGNFIAIENYYAKTVYELGLPGLSMLALMFAAIVLNGLGTVRLATTREGRILAGALVAFVVVVCLNSFKGWALDLDPLNVYFWLFAGALAKLRYLA